MNEAEKKALESGAVAWNDFLMAVQDNQDRREACAAMHVIQNILMAQATRRAHPDLFSQVKAYD